VRNICLPSLIKDIIKSYLNRRRLKWLMSTIAKKQQCMKVEWDLFIYFKYAIYNSHSVLLQILNHFCFLSVKKHIVREDIKWEVILAH